MHVQCTLHAKPILFHFFWDVYLVQVQHRSKFIQSVDIDQLLSKLVADERLQDEVDHSNKVRGVDNVELLYVLLVSEVQQSGYNKKWTP